MSPLDSPSSSASAPGQAPSAQALVFWVLWSSMTTGVILVHHFLGAGPRPAASDAGTINPVALVALGAVVASAIIRWAVLPRLGTLQKKLPAFVVAAAMAESCGILGVLVAREHQRELFVASLLGLLQLAPFFALPRSARRDAFPRSDT